MLAGFVANVTFGFVKASVMFAAVGSAGTFGGYDQGSIGAYVWISQGLLGAVGLGMTGVLDIADRIKNGDVAIDFIRPIDIQASYLAAELGRATYTFLPRGLPTVLVGAVTFGLALPTSALPYALGIVSIALAVTVSYLAQFGIAILGFWVVETRGLRTLYMIAATFLAGLFVPIHIFPDWLQTVAHATPFPSMLQTPVDVLSGRTVGLDALEVVGVQALWTAVICLIGRALLVAGRRKLEVQGG